MCDVGHSLSGSDEDMSRTNIEVERAPPTAYELPQKGIKGFR